MTTRCLQVVTTTDSAEEAERLAHGIVAEHLGACVHITAVTSVYRWQGEVEQAPEWRLAVKTAADRLDALVAHIRERHSYDLPQVVAVEIAGGSAEYLDWVVAETRTAETRAVE
ncbi:divalent-cation tolerance protein CutA [Actinokineospora sp. NBRC 105648]|uniref:divalent-cation tolerance protein CutA n=1 Tax=Actinokineospora sp. NBRC 105648 TaxID=3032206 RepID=UPI0024A18DF0|nr:divalent-cation tolerance protein CutA [Actinokineospora sp. NBRC 105648]GLZ36456.1 divalent cation tolerance protein [Actinokineospora sp. NBRC 105648]